MQILIKRNSNYDVNESGTIGLNTNQQKKPQTNDYVAGSYDRKWYRAEFLGTSNDDAQGATLSS